MMPNIALSNELALLYATRQRRVERCKVVFEGRFAIAIASLIQSTLHETALVDIVLTASIQTDTHACRRRLPPLPCQDAHRISS